MTKTTKTTARRPRRASPGRGRKATTKVETIKGLLTRKNGCTRADVKAATGWPSVSMAQQAAAAGLRLRQERRPGELTRYYGTPA